MMGMMDGKDRFEVKLTLVIASQGADEDDIGYFLRDEFKEAWMGRHDLELERLDVMQVVEL